jgi:hypothetical protein
MSKLEEARTILKQLQVPVKQQSDMCCYVLLSLAGSKKGQSLFLWDAGKGIEQMN